MNTAPRWLLCVVAACTVLFGTCAARPDWAAGVGLDVRALPEMGRQIEQDQRDADRLSADIVAARRRCVQRRQIVDDLRRGRVGLLGAAARFRDLNAAAGPAAPDPGRCFGGASPDERCCRQVIAWARGWLQPEEPEEAARLTAALEAELRDELRRDGGVRLPH